MMMRACNLLLIVAIFLTLFSIAEAEELAYDGAEAIGYAQLKERAGGQVSIFDITQFGR
jgi:hypothetical protein